MRARVRQFSQHRVWYTAAVLTAIVLLVLAIGGNSAQATTYVSLRGQFSIDFPKDWVQVDYLTVDYFLNAIGADSSAYNYDAVYAINKQGQFHDNEYMILTLEPGGKLSRREQDSVVTELGGGTDWDRATGLVTIANEDPTSPKSSLFALKFYDKGIAQFYFFSPDSTFAQYLPVFKQVLASFSTENLESKLPREEVKLADPDKIRDGAGSGSTEDSSDRALFSYSVVGSALVVVIVIVSIVARRKRRNHSQPK